MRSSDFYDIVSGRRRGLIAKAIRFAFTLIEGPYRAVVWWRNRRYDRTSGAVIDLEVPVISVGNLTLGGTGKTPIVKWLARSLRAQGVRVAIVSRGYGVEAGSKNDEALELEQALPDVPHVQNPNRVEAAQVAVEELDAQMILMDDGFQHRRLGRDLDIVLLDATEPFGYEHVFPRGALREPVTSLRRAQVVCLTRADLVDQKVRETIRQRVEIITPKAVWCESIARPGRLIGASAETLEPAPEASLEILKGERVAAFCGIGNPKAFRQTLESLGAKIIAFEEFEDHHAYCRADIDRIADASADAELIVCTHKDLVKVRLNELKGKALWAVEIEAELTVGHDDLRACLQTFVESLRQ